MGSDERGRAKEKKKKLVKNRSTKLRFVKKNVEDFDISQKETGFPFSVNKT